MKTHDADLCERIRELEDRVRKLESAPVDPWWPWYRWYPDTHWYYPVWTPPYTGTVSTSGNTSTWTISSNDHGDGSITNTAIGAVNGTS